VPYEVKFSYLLRASNKRSLLQAVENEETFSYFYGVLSTDDLKILTFEDRLKLDFCIDHLQEILLTFIFFFHSTT